MFKTGQSVVLVSDCPNASLSVGDTGYIVRAIPGYDTYEVKFDNITTCIHKDKLCDEKEYDEKNVPTIKVLSSVERVNILCEKICDMKGYSEKQRKLLQREELAKAELARIELDKKELQQKEKVIRASIKKLVRKNLVDSAIVVQVNETV